MSLSPWYTREMLRTLVVLHLSRLRRPVVAMLTGMIVLSSIDIAKHGVRVDSILPWLLGGTMIMPLAPAFTMVREKADGSLRYLASLPVPGQLHAVARITVAAIMSFAPASLTGVALHLMMAAPILALSMAAFIGTWVILTVISLLLLTAQLKARIGDAATYAMYALVGLLGLTQAVAFGHERGWFDGAVAFAVTGAGITLASILTWTVMSLLGWLAFRSIASTSVSYRGEPADA